MGRRMTGPQFTHWLAAMKAAGLAQSDAHCGRLLSISPVSIVAIKRRGADHRTALACAALLAGIEPYSINPQPE